jgi:hypothetical protein
MYTMHVAIIFPPISTPPSSPPPSLAALKAYLSRHSACSIEIRDFNVEFFRFFYNHWEIVHPLLENRFRQRFEYSTPSSRSDKSLSLLLHIYLPLINNLITQYKNSKSDELLIKLLSELIHGYYTSNLLVDGYFLRCDYRQLSHTINQFLSDPIMTHFVRSSSLKRPDLLGFSLLSESQLPFAILFSRLFRISYPNLPVVAGGPYITEILTQPLRSVEIFEDFDYLIAQEGESALHSVIESLITGQATQHQNVFTNTDFKKRALFVEPIESLPPLCFDDLDLNLYFTPDFSLPMYTSKGCSWGKCKFCSQNSLYYREKNIETFVSDLQYVTQHTNVTHFQFTDENIRPTRLKELSEEIIKRGLTIRWFIQIRFDKDIDYPLLELMKRAGCYAIEFGLESGSSEVLRRIKKGINLKNVERILGYCADLEYIVVLNCMVGFPEETMELAEQTISFLDSIIKNIPRLRITCNTQIVKIYTNAIYTTTGEVTSSAYPLSTVADWQGPTWLNEFRHRFSNHIIFSGQTHLPLTTREESTPLTVEGEPMVALSPDCYVLEGIEYDFSTCTPTTKPRSYLVIVKSGMLAPNIFTMNDVMISLVNELKDADSKLHLLRERFFRRYQNTDKDSVASAFSDGLVRLNDIGAISVC